MSTRSKAAGLAGAILIAATSVSGVVASSHREAPLISGDPNADNTDLYAFVSPDDTDSLTIIANYVPLQEPAGGPNFFPFDDTVRYEIHIDNNGDARPDSSYAFRFSSAPKATNFAGIPTFLYNDGPITSLTDENWLVPQTYDVERNGARIGNNLPTPPANIGRRSTPNYAALASAAVTTLPDGTKVFAGQRDDAFFVDLGSIFDLAGLRPFNELHAIQLPPEPGADGVSGFNTNAIALQIPIEQLTKDHALPSGPNDPDAVLGVWATASRQKHRTLNDDGTVHTSGKWVQVSRLGNPLINEVIIPRLAKDYWNSQAPAGDSRFAKYYLAPELAPVASVLYSALTPPATTGRGDLVAILLTGLNIPNSTVVPGGLQFTRTGNTQADVLRVNTGIKPNPSGACVFGVVGGGSPSRLGALAGDLCGFPNGRRLLDDVADIELRAVVQGYGATLNAVLGVPNLAPNNLIGDGVDANDLPFLSSFPYESTPHSGYEHVHRHGMNPLP